VENYNARGDDGEVFLLVLVVVVVVVMVIVVIMIMVVVIMVSDDRKHLSMDSTNSAIKDNVSEPLLELFGLFH
jgi:uncharacterized membrane protein